MADLVITQWGTTTITTQAALTEISNVFVNVFNRQPNLSPSDVTGAYIQELTDQRVNVNNICAYICSNVYSLNNTNGIFLDGIGALFGIDRTPATIAEITCQLTGLPNLVIPANQQVSNGTNVFYNKNQIVLNSSGLGSGEFYALAGGQITIQANTINTIITPLAGWSTINNNTGGTLGSEIQNDTAYRYTMRFCQAINGRTFVDSLYAVLQSFIAQDGTKTVNAQGINIPYIQGFYIYSNYTDSDQEIVSGLDPIPVGGVYITLYAPEYLSNDNPDRDSNLQYIAGIILNQLGANTTHNIQDDGDNKFIVDYVNTAYPGIDNVTVKFDKPIATPIKFDYTIKLYQPQQSRIDLTVLIKNAILDQFYNGYNKNGVQYNPATMNTAINSGDYIISILNVVGGCTINAQNVEVITGGTPGTSLTLTVDKIATLALADINITFE